MLLVGTTLFITQSLALPNHQRFAENLADWAALQARSRCGNGVVNSGETVSPSSRTSLRQFPPEAIFMLYFFFALQFCLHFDDGVYHRHFVYIQCDGSNHDGKLCADDPDGVRCLLIRSPSNCFYISFVFFTVPCGLWTAYEERSVAHYLSWVGRPRWRRPTRYVHRNSM